MCVQTQKTPHAARAGACFFQKHICGGETVVASQLHGCRARFGVKGGEEKKSVRDKGEKCFRSSHEVFLGKIEKNGGGTKRKRRGPTGPAFRKGDVSQAKGGGQCRGGTNKHTRLSLSLSPRAHVRRPRSVRLKGEKWDNSLARCFCFFFVVSLAAPKHTHTQKHTPPP